jgi:hypothetical protein
MSGFVGSLSIKTPLNGAKIIVGKNVKTAVVEIIHAGELNSINRLYMATFENHAPKEQMSCMHESLRNRVFERRRLIYLPNSICPQY